MPARVSPLTSGTAANAAVAWPRARARSAGGTSPAASAVVSTARTNGHRLRSAAARETSPVSVFPMITPARSRESPCPPGKPASASARPAVSRASQWAGSAARKVRSSMPKPARSNCHPSSSAARGAEPLAEPGRRRSASGPRGKRPAAQAAASGTRAVRPGRSRTGPADRQRPGTCRLGRRWQSVLRCCRVRCPQAWAQSGRRSYAPAIISFLVTGTFNRPRDVHCFPGKDRSCRNCPSAGPRAAPRPAAGCHGKDPSRRPGRRPGAPWQPRAGAVMPATASSAGGARRHDLDDLINIRFRRSTRMRDMRFCAAGRISQWYLPLRDGKGRVAGIPYRPACPRLRPVPRPSGRARPGRVPAPAGHTGRAAGTDPGPDRPRPVRRGLRGRCPRQR